MTFLAVIAGLILGGMVGDIFGGDDQMFLGALAGGVIAWLLRRKGKAPAADARVEALENRVRELDDAVSLLRARLQRLEDGKLKSVARDPSDLAEWSTTPDEVVEEAPTDTFAVAAASEPPYVPETSTPSLDADAPALSDAWGTPPAETPAWITRTLAWFTGGNTVVRVGIVVLFFGVAFLLKFAYDHSKLPPEFRVGGAMLGGIALAAIGWRLREKRPGYALALQGGAVGVMYLAVFSALRLYALVPPGFAFALLAMIAAFSAALALLQNAQSLAVLGVAGGFLAPVLASTGAGSHVALFGYYAVLNAGIVAIATRRAWRPLNLTGFAFTFVISALWGARSWRPELWATTQPFLALFFLLYLAIPTFFSRHAEARGDRALDGTLVFGLPIVAFGLQTRIVSGFEYGAAISALAAAAIYVLAARHVLKRDGDDRSLLVTSFAALALLFATLTIPLALDARWTSAAWALEGAALVWIGLRQGRLLPRLAGYALQLAAAVSFAGGPHGLADGFPIANRDFLGFLFLAVAAGFSSRQLHRHAESAKPWEVAVGVGALLYGLVWWLAGGVHEIETQTPAGWQAQLDLVFFGLTCAGLQALGSRLAWPAARQLALLHLPLAVVAFMAQAHDYRHPFSHLGFIAWPVAFALHLWILRRHEAEASRVVPWLHAATLWLAVPVGSWELEWLARRFTEEAVDWSFAAAMVPSIAVLVGLPQVGTGVAWPVMAHARSWFLHGAGVVAAALLAFVALAAFDGRGITAPLPYVPLLNPLDLASAAALVAVFLWLRALGTLGLDTLFASLPWLKFGVPGAVAFVAANGMLLRALHRYAEVTITFPEVLDSRLAQAGFSILWTILAATAMVSAHRSRQRALWMTGAGLLGATVAKLFVVDLSGAGTVERIVSFIGVGLLMLAIGWFSPVPPKRPEASA
jgi:uncharacterized membrane protein